MAKKNQWIAIVIIGVVVLFATGIIKIPTLAIPSFGGVGGTGDTTVVQGGTGYQPVLSLAITDAKTGAPISSALDQVQFNITNLQGQTRITPVAYGSTTNVNLGEKYVAWAKPNATYYANKTEGTIQGATTALSIPAKYKNTITTWVNNDSSNSTMRNSGSGVGTAPDTLAAGVSLNPTLHLQGVTLNRYWGDGAIDLVADYNGSQISAITFGAINCHGTSINPTSTATAPQTHSQASGTTVYVGARYNCFVDSTETIAIPVNVQAQSAYTADNDSNVSFKAYDVAYLKNTVTGAFEFRNADDLGNDSNSATNPSAQAYALS